MTSVRQVLSCHRPYWCAICRSRAQQSCSSHSRRCAGAPAQPPPGQQFRDDGLGLLPVGGQHAVGDPALPVVGPDHLLAAHEPGWVRVRRRVAVTAFGVDEDRAAFGVGARGARRAVGDQQQPLARPGLAQAAPQRRADLGVDLHLQLVARLVLPGGTDRVQVFGRDRLVGEGACCCRWHPRRLYLCLLGHAIQPARWPPLILAGIGHRDGSGSELSVSGSGGPFPWSSNRRVPPPMP
jgi:hypothetical protein